MFARDETPFTDSDDSDSDADDTTPLVNPTENNTTRGGTFEPQSENPFLRAARSISQQSQVIITCHTVKSLFQLILNTLFL